MNQPPNTPLNAGDELRRYVVQEIAHMVAIGIKTGKFNDWSVGNMIADKVLADRKKHELQARKDQTFKVIQSLVKSGSISDSSAAHTLALHNTLLDDQSKQELENL